MSERRTAIPEYDSFHLQQVVRMLADLGAIHREQDGQVWIEGFEIGPYLSERQAAAVCRALDALDGYSIPPTPCPRCNNEGIVHDMAGNMLGPCDCTGLDSGSDGAPT